VRHVSGTVTVNDGSGAIDIEDAGGLNIINTGSGGLRVREVQGQVSI